MSAVLGIGLIRKTVAYIFSGEVSGEKLTSVNPLGTGFLVGIPNQRIEGSIWAYFVTAKHVLRNESGGYRTEVFVRANLKNWSPSSGQVGARFARLAVTDGNGNLAWTIHPNPAVDIAILPSVPQPETYDIQVVPVKAFAIQQTLSRWGIVEGQELFFPCFTPEIPQQRRNSPVIRFGRISLISDEDFLTPEGSTRLHFAECFPFGGNSGSPVFLRRVESIAESERTQEKYGLFGIMKGHFNVGQPVMIQQTQPRLLVRQHMGIAAITPVDYLMEILYNDDLRRRRDEIS